MRLSRLGWFVVLLAAFTESASASTIKMVGGGGSEPFPTLPFSIVLNETGSDCENNAGCIFDNQTGQTLSALEFVFSFIPNPPGGSYNCAVGTGSPFSTCSVFLSPNSLNPTQVDFTFTTGSLPSNCSPEDVTPCEFGLAFATLDGTPDPFPPNSTFEATDTPEPGSAVLLLTCLGGILIVWRGMRKAARFGA